MAKTWFAGFGFRIRRESLGKRLPRDDRIQRAYEVGSQKRNHQARTSTIEIGCLDKQGVNAPSGAEENAIAPVQNM
jgi:hypothetical protein